MNNNISMKKIQDYLVRLILSNTGLEEEKIDINQPFVDFGLTSIQVVGISGELCEFLDEEIEPTIIWDYPNIFELSQYLYELKCGGSSFSESKVEDLVSDNKSEPIAIVGIGCRFPGTYDNKSFLDLLTNGKDMITSLSNNRFKDNNIDSGGFIEDYDKFDKSFFGFSTYESERMDPQQRLLLHVTWEALEDAGINNELLKGSATGVFIGISNSDYTYNMEDSKYCIELVVGNSASIAANRISYLLKLTGPSMSIDTACSSSLVAVHEACKSIREDECNVAIVGGVNLILNPNITKSFYDAGMLSPDGKCKVFDDSANGYVRGEGAGVIILKKLSKAIYDKDNIYAVIRGSAVNQNGGSNGLTAPNGKAQEAVIRTACAKANIKALDLQYVELHGTGTALGDPIEANALGNAIGENRIESCLVGSVKSNIGHLEAAAGIAGIIKVALMIKEKVIVPSLNFHTANKLINLEKLKLKVVTENMNWNEEKKLLAGVSSFGFGGTNAHVVLDGFEQHKEFIVDIKNNNNNYLIPFSAKNEQALISLFRKYANISDSELIENIAYTNLIRKTHYDLRTGIIANNTKELKSKLQDILEEKDNDDVIIGEKNRENNMKICFVFSGQGNQYADMGKKLWNKEEIFRNTLIQCDEIWQKYSDFSLCNMLMNLKDTDLEETFIIQPLTFAIQMALAKLWEHWGVKPKCVIGHSMGEIAAMCIAGVTSLEDSVKIIYYRSMLTQRLKSKGKMIIINKSEAFCKNLINDFNSKLSIAVINSDEWTVVSGDNDVVSSLEEKLKEDEVFFRELQGEYAFHSYQMKTLKNEFVNNLKDLKSNKQVMKVFSTVTGKELDNEEVNELYWGDNLVKKVQFSKALECAVEENCNIFIEISPHPVLINMIKLYSQKKNINVITLPSLSRDKVDSKVILKSLANLYVAGYPIKLEDIIGGIGDLISLPKYPWDNKRYWLGSKDVSGYENEDNSIVEKNTIKLRFNDRNLDKYVAPRNEMEEFIAEIWSELLGVNKVSVYSNFFELGGHSLLAVQFLNRIKEIFPFELSISKLYKEPTIAKISEEIDKQIMALSED